MMDTKKNNTFARWLRAAKGELSLHKHDFWQSAAICLAVAASFGLARTPPLRG